MDFQAVSESLGGGIQEVSVRGEIDLATGPELERELLALPEDSAASVVVDLMDCTGLHLLTRTQRRFDGITGIDQLLAIYPSRAAANGDADD